MGIPIKSAYERAKRLLTDEPQPSAPPSIVDVILAGQTAGKPANAPA